MVAQPKDLGDLIDAEIEKATAELAPSDLEHLGWQAINIVTLRTKQGLDADLYPFVPYSTDYAKERQRAGYSTTPDLARTGHMLGAMIPNVVGDEVRIQFLSAIDERKAAIHNQGSFSASSVAAHSRSVYVDAKTGRRVSRQEAARDKKRKKKRVTVRTENVGEHRRLSGTPKREFFDIRHPREVEAIGAALGEVYQARVK